MVSNPLKVQWIGGLGRMRHCKIRKLYMAHTHTCDELAGDLFAENNAFIALELALFTLEWAFAAVGKLVSG